MTSKTSTNLTARDYEIVAALLKTPLDARQLLQLSSTFATPFTHERLVRRRLSQLAELGLVHRYRYATFTSGSLNYYKPTPLGFRLIEGAKAKLPPRSFFREVSLALQGHTRALADFVVTTYSAAHRQGIAVTDFYRENNLRLKLGTDIQQPDCAFQLVLADGTSLNYLVEIDCGTEPIRSNRQRESLEKKIRFYDAYQDQSTNRFRVLVLFTKPSVRITHFCQTVKDCVKNRDRTLCYAGVLSSYVDHAEPLTAPLFVDHHQRQQSLLPSQLPTSFPEQATAVEELFVGNLQTVW